MPAIFIRRLVVSDSTFLGPIDLEFNPQFNALIGGRGTGKTSILEYIRYAMQDQPIEDPEDESVHDEIAQKRARILQTLHNLNASVTLEWINNGVVHEVQFASGTQRPTLKVAGGPPTEVQPDELRSLLPFRAYSQKQLSTVGIREKELRRFIEQPIQQLLAEGSTGIVTKRHELERLYDELATMREKNRALAAIRTALRSTQEQAMAVQESLSDLPPDFQKAMNEHPLRLQEQQAVEDLRADLAKGQAAVNAVIELLASVPRPVTLDERSPQHAKILSLHAKAAKLIGDIRDAVSTQSAAFDQVNAVISGDIGDWQRGHDEHESLYKKAEEVVEDQKDNLDLLKKLQAQEALLRKQISELEGQVAGFSTVNNAFDAAWTSWVAIHRSRGDAMEKACEMLSEKSDGEIDAELLRGADYHTALQKLREVLKGCGIREENWEALEQYLAREGPARAWMVLMEGLRPLAEMSKEDIPADGTVPEIPNWGLTPTMRRNIVERLKPGRRWLDVALTSLEDLPVFYYKAKGGNRIKFADASAGQQATALLRVLLRESTGPLLIDQPEEDLDNATIQTIAQELWRAKERRQIIFSSHNANIVVNGDAELVMQCGYRTETDKTKGHVAREGAIDIPEIREAIQDVMEGGKDAFELRRQKYGF